MLTGHFRSAWPSSSISDCPIVRSDGVTLPRISLSEPTAVAGAPTAVRMAFLMTSMKVAMAPTDSHRTTTATMMAMRSHVTALSSGAAACGACVRCPV